MSEIPPLLPSAQEPKLDVDELPKTPVYSAYDIAHGVPSFEHQLAKSLNEAVKVDPDLRAEARSLGIGLGMDPAIVERNIDKIRALAVQRSRQAQELARISPVLARQLIDPEFAALAHDDLDNLQAVEGFLNGWNRGAIESELAVLHNTQSRLAELRDTSPELQQRIDDLTERLNSLPTGGFQVRQVFSDPLDAFRGLLASIGHVSGQMWPSVRDSLPEMIAGAVAGGLIGGPPGAVAGAKWVGGAEMARQIYIQERGASYGELLDLGIEHTTASQVSAATGAINTVLELYGLHLISAPARAGFRQFARNRISANLREITMRGVAGRAAKDILTAGAIEGTEEVLQELVNYASEEYALSVAGTANAFENASRRPALVDRMWSVAQEAFGGGLGLGVLPAGVRAMADTQRVRRGEASQEFMESLSAGAQNSKTAERATDMFERFVARVADGHPVENLYFDATRFDKVLAQAKVSRESLRKVLPEVEAQIDEAKRTGGDVVIPTATYGAKISRTPLDALLRQEARISPDYPSIGQLAKEKAQAEKTADQAEKVLQKHLDDADQFASEAREIEQGIEQQLVEVGRYTPDEAKTGARLYYNWLVVTADRLNKMPREVFAQYPYRIVSDLPTQTGDILAQMRKAPHIMIEARPNAQPELLERWDALSAEQRKTATAEIVTRVVRGVSREFGVQADVYPVRGAWMGEPEAATAVVLDRPEHSIDIAKTIGSLLHQDAMFVVSPVEAPGLQRGAGILIHLPEGYTDAQIDALYRDVLWPIEVNGKRAIVGHSTEGSHMIIGIDEADLGITAEELVERIVAEVDAKVAESEDIQAQVHNVYTKFLNRETDYEDSATEPSAARGSPVETRRDRLVGETAEAYRDALDRAERREPGPDATGYRRRRGSVAPSYGTPREHSVSVVGVHFSQEQRDTLDSRRGTGLRGAERRRIEGDPVLSRRIYFYADVGFGVRPEQGLGRYGHLVRLENLYDINADPLGIAASVSDVTPEARANAMEQAVHDAGFDGVYVSHSPYGPIAYLIGSQHTAVPVEPLDQAHEVLQQPEMQVPAAFFSALSREIENLDTKRATAANWKQALKGLVKKGKIKEDELFWTGLRDWLDSRPVFQGRLLPGLPRDLADNKISKEAVLTYLREKGVQIRVQQLASYPLTEKEGGEESEVIPTIGDSAFEEYTLMGGTRYREVLLSFPVLPVESEAPGITGHFRQTPNVFAHYRVKERVDASGQRTLFIEELQSDWGQNLSGSTEMPFIMSTKSWLNLLLKQVLLDAVNNGYDSVGIINGMQSAIRYDLAAYINEYAIADVDPDGSFWLTIETNRENFLFHVDYDDEIIYASMGDVAGRQLEELVGQTDARRITDTVQVAIQDLDEEAYTIKKVADVSEEELEENGRLEHLTNEMKDRYVVFDADGFLETDRIGYARLFSKEEALEYVDEQRSLQLRDADPIRISPGQVNLETPNAQGMMRFYDTIVPQALGKLVKKLTGSNTVETGVDTPGIDFDDVDTYTRLEIDPKLHKAVAAGLPLFQTGERGARGSFAPRELLTVLHEGAEFSTVMHEMAHYFFEVHQRILDGPNPPQALVDDFNTFLDWTGVESMDAWRGMSFEERRPHTEAFAFAFEIYLFEGRAPSERMARLFDKVRRFMTHVYRDILLVLNPLYRENYGRDLPALTDEMRSVFGRMLAAEQEVERADAARGFAPLFETQAEAGMSDTEWAGYVEALNAAREASITDVQKASLRQMQWLSGARSRVLKELQAKHRKLREQTEEEVAAEVREQPVYRAIRYLRRGEIDLVDGGSAPVEGVHRLNTEQTRALLPAGTSLTSHLSGMTARDGVDPAIVAELFGFESAQALVEALVEAPPLQDAVRSLTDARMASEHGDLIDEKQVEREIQKALHNQARVRFATIELKFLQRAQQPTRVLTAAAKIAAGRILGRKRVRDIRPHEAAAAEMRARRAAEEAVKRNDPQAAITAKQQELLQHHLFRASIAAEEKVEKALKFMRQFKRSDKNLAKTRNVDYIGIGRALLFRHGLVNEPTDARPHLENVEKYAPELLDDLEPLIGPMLSEATPWNEMPFDDFRMLEDSLRALWHQSRRDRVIKVGERVEELEIAVNAVEKALNVPEAERRGKTRSTKEARRFELGAVRAWFRQVEAWAVAMDGGTPGVIHEYLFSILRGPVNAYLSEKQSLTRALYDRVNAHDFGDRRKPIKSHELNFEFRNKAQLVGAIMHAGNSSNLRTLLLGFGMVPQPQERGGPINTAAWWSFVKRMIDEKVLTQADFDLAQYVWDIYDGLLPRSQAAHFDLYGYRFEEIPKVPIETPWGTYRGGYIPLKYDPISLRERSPNSVVGDPIKASSQEYRDSFPSTGRGFTITRMNEVQEGFELILDPRMAVHSFDEHLRFIHLQRPGRDLLRLLRSPRINNALARLDPNLVKETFMPWVNSTLRNQIMSPGGPSALVNFLSVLRGRTGLLTMFGNVCVGLQQLTGIGNSLLYVKREYLRSAAATYLRTLFTGRLAEDIKRRSEFMALRLDKGVGQVRDDIDVLLTPRWLGRAEQWFRENGYFLQRWFQIPVDIITWAARFNQSIAEGRDETQAVIDADTAVRRSQGSGLVADMSRLEKGNALVRLVMQFSSFWVTSANAVLHRPTVKDRITAGALVVAFGGLAAGAIVRALRGGWGDDDDDGALWDDVTNWAFSEALSASASLVLPTFGPAILRPVTGEFGGRLTLGAGVSAFERATATPLALLTHAISDERELSGRLVKDFGVLISLLLGLPVAAVTDRARFLLDQDADEIEKVRGLIVGR